MPSQSALDAASRRTGGRPRGRARIPRGRYPAGEAVQYKRELVAYLKRYWQMIESAWEGMAGLLDERASDSVALDSLISDLSRRLGEIKDKIAGRLADAREDAVVKDLVDKWAARIHFRATDQFKREIRAAVGVDPFLDNRALFDVVTLHTQANVRLIKDLPGEMYRRLDQTVMEGVRTGIGREKLADKIKEIAGVSDSRAALIARDQTAKLQNSIIHEEHTQAGLKSFRWRTMNDPVVRPGDRPPTPGNNHRDLEGKVFAWAEGAPRAYSKTGFPGQDVNCRCWAELVLDEARERAGVPPVKDTTPGTAEKPLRAEPMIKDIPEEVRAVYAEQETAAFAELDAALAALPEADRVMFERMLREGIETVKDKTGANRASAEVFITRLYENFRRTALAGDEGAVAKTLTSGWRVSSQDRLAGIMKQIVAEQVPKAPVVYHGEYLDEIKELVDKFKAAALENISTFGRDRIEAATSLIYKTTQTYLKRLFPEGKIKLYRAVRQEFFETAGLGDPPAIGRKVAAQFDALTSWSLDRRAAGWFADFVMEIEVPISEVVIGPMYGIAIEQECVVVGGKRAFKLVKHPRVAKLEAEAKKLAAQEKKAEALLKQYEAEHGA